MSRIAEKFAALKAAKHKAFITFTTAGDPDLQTFAAILAGQPKAGVDLIEIGMPFSDPVADGPAIERANLRAFAAGITMQKILGMVADFRKQDKITPIILMGYANPVYSYGLEKFIGDVSAAGVDGLIIADLPPEEDGELRACAVKKGLDVIRLLTPTTDAKRLPVILNGAVAVAPSQKQGDGAEQSRQNINSAVAVAPSQKQGDGAEQSRQNINSASGFLYYVSVAGITGTKQAGVESIQQAVEFIRPHTHLPIGVGFGISTPEQAQEIAKVADAVIVGSAIVNRIAANLDAGGQAKTGLVEDVLGFVRTLADAVHKN